MMGSLDLENKKIIIIDGMNLFHRVFHSYKDLTSKKGHPTGALFGYLNSLEFLLNKYNSNKFVVVWEGDSNWRNDESDDYKSREKTEDRFTNEEKHKFHMSFDTVREFLKQLGVLQIEKDGHEADDLIYYITQLYGEDVVIVSNDKDFLQLVNDEKEIFVARPKKGGGYDNFRKQDVVEKFGVTPKQIPYFLALSGDTSDNVKGVYGIGPVKAKKLIKNGSLKKDKIRETFTKEQLKDFINSLKLVKMKGLEDKIQIDKNDFIELTYSFPIDEINYQLKEYNFVKFTGLGLKILVNKSFQIDFIKNMVGN